MEHNQNNGDRQKQFLGLNQSTVSEFFKGRKTSKKVEDYFYKIINKPKGPQVIIWKIKIR